MPVVTELLRWMSRLFRSDRLCDLWLSSFGIGIGWFTLSIQETNQWATGYSLSLRDGPWKKKTSVGPLSASAHGENARLPIQPCWNPGCLKYYWVNRITQIKTKTDIPRSHFQSRLTGCSTVFWRNKYVNLCFLNICKIWCLCAVVQSKNDIQHF